MLVIERGMSVFYTKNERVFVQYGLPWAEEYDRISLMPGERLFINRRYFILELFENGSKIVISLSHNGCIDLDDARRLGRRALECCKRKVGGIKLVVVNDVGASCISGDEKRFDCD